MFERFHCFKFPLHMVPNWVDSLFWHKTILVFSWFIGSIPTFIIFHGKRHVIFLTFFRLGIPFIVPIISPSYIPSMFGGYPTWCMLRRHFHRWKMHCLRQDEVGIVGTPINKLVNIGLITRTVDISIVAGINQ